MSDIVWVLHLLVLDSSLDIVRIATFAGPFDAFKGPVILKGEVFDRFVKLFLDLIRLSCHDEGSHWQDIVLPWILFNDFIRMEFVESEVTH